MAEWTGEELTRIEAAEELQIASLRRDGTLRNPVTIWVVRQGDNVYVRSVNGRTGSWFRGTRASHQGWIWVGGLEKDVELVDAPRVVDDQVDAAYRGKYRRYAESIVSTIVSPEAREATIKLAPHAAA